MDDVERVMSKVPDKSYFRIGEVARATGVKAYVLRYWETEFKAMIPPKSRSKQRMYRRKDIETVLRIKQLLYKDRFTIEGARKRLAELQRETRAPAAGRAPSGRPAALGTIRSELEEICDLLAADL
jgi:DNA-binding transcriptional MerR regulator